MNRGRDGRQIAAEVGAELDYLSGISRRLGLPDLVEDYFAPVVGSWGDLQEEAERWRRAGLVAEHVTRDLTKPLGKLDSAWQGRDAESFVAHMQSVGLAGHDMSDAMHAMGDALDETAEGIRGIVEDMARVFAEAADTASGAAALPLDGDRRVVEVLEELKHPAKELYESVRDVLEAFLRLCDGVSGDSGFADVTMEHKYPEKNWTFEEPGKAAAAPPPSGGPAPAPEAATKPAGGSAGGGAPGGAAGGGVPGGGVPGGGVPGGGSDAAERLGSGGYTSVQEPRPVESGPRPAAAVGGGGGAATGGVGMGGMMGGGMMGAMGAGGQQGGDKEHQSKYRRTASTEELLGKPKKTSPQVLGED